MKNFRLSPLFLAIIALPAFSATEELIVTGTYSPVTNEQLSSSVSILNKEELLQLSEHSLVDALRQVPSLWVEEQGGPGGITSIALRGAEANHTLVLLDGVELNDPTNTRGGAFDLNGINIESIERIEIIRGAQSSVYGSDALAGVIHIITKTPGEQTTQLNGTLGTDDYSSVGVSTSGSLDKLGYAFSLQGKDAGEPVEGSTAKNTEFTSRLNWQQDIHALNFNYRYFDGERTSFPEQSGGPEYAVDRDLDTSEYTDQSAALGWAVQVNEFWKSKTNASWYEREETYASPGIAPYDAVPANGSTTDFTRTSFSWINTLGDEQKLWGNIGVETRKEEGDSQGYLDIGFEFPTDFSLSRRIDSGFINLNGYATEQLLLQASIRRDDAEDIAANTSEQLGIRYSINDQLVWFANWGEGFKLPSFFALGHPLVGNSDLKPETVTSADTGIEFTQDKINIRLSYFENDYKDLIDFDSETFRNVNRAQVETSGVESEVNWQALENLAIRVHGTYTDIDMLSSDNHLLGRPQFTYGTSVNYAFNEAWSFNLQYMRVDDRFAVSRYTGTDVEETLDAYNRFDANVHWQLNAQTRFGLSLENLADEDYYTDIGFPAPGRGGKLSVVMSF
jgi:outer membrane cobalamin receptor